MSFHRADGSGKISLKLQNGRPEDSEAWPELHIYPGPQCTYRVSVGIAWSDLCGQVCTVYLPLQHTRLYSVLTCTMYSSVLCIHLYCVFTCTGKHVLGLRQCLLKFES